MSTMIFEDKGKSTSDMEMEDWIQELLPDFPGEMGLFGEGLPDLPQPNHSITTAPTSSSSHIPRIFPASFPRQEWQNQIVDLPSNAYQLPIPSNSISTSFRPQMIPTQNQELGFLPARNPTPVGQIHTGNQSQSQTMLLGGQFALPESIPTPAQPNSMEWVNEAYKKLTGLKEMIMSEVLTFHRRTQAKIQSSTTAEVISRYEGIRRTAERVMNFVGMSQAEMSRWSKEKLYKSINQAVMYYNCVRTSNSISPSAASFRLENNLRLNNPVRTSAPSYQRQQLPGIDSRALGSFLGPTRESNRAPTDQANAKRMKSLWRKEEKKPVLFSGSQGIQMEWKDLLPRSSALRPPVVSMSVSASAFLSPTTPSDFAKSPVSVESCRFAPSCSDPPLMKANQNPTDVGEQSTDPVKRLVNAVMSMSPSTLNSAIQDMYAVTILSDRVATDFVNGGSMKIIQRDLADDIAKFRMQSATKDQMESGMGYCAKLLKKEPYEFLLEEIEEINQKFMELKVDVMNMDVVSRKGYNGDVLIRFSYIPVGPASQQMASKLLLELTVPPGYPNSPPIVSDKMLPSCCDFEEGENLWMKAKLSFSLKLRKLGEPMTVKQLAKAWEDSAREVFLEYAERLGGGSLLSSTRSGSWESLGVAF